MRTRFIERYDVYFVDEEWFADKNEHYFNMKCFDSYAIGTATDEEQGEVLKIKVTYPRRKDILADDEKSEYVLDYCGLWDLTPNDITYADIMLACGEIESTYKRSDYTNKVLLTNKHYDYA